MKVIENKLCGLILAMIIIACLLLCIDSIGLDAYAANSDYYSENKYTESDKLLNSDGTELQKSIRDFSLEVKNANNNTSFGELAMVIPRQFLESTETNAVFAYNGKEYGFYVAKEGERFDILLIDFIFDESDLPDIEFRIRIDPILQQSFMRNNTSNGYEWKKYDGVGYKYYVANPTFLSTLHNANALNYLDEGYSKYADDGLIISQYRANYGKINYATEEDFYKELENLTINQMYTFGMSVADLTTFGILGTVVDYIMNFVQFGVNLNNVAKENTITVGNEANITTRMSKTAQREDTTTQSYSRTAAFTPAENIVLNDNEDSYAELITVLNDADYKSRLTQLCEFSIVRRSAEFSSMEFVTDKNKNVSFMFSNERDIFQERSPIFEFDSINFENESIPVYLLPRGEQEVYFTPQYSGIYNFETPLNTQLSLNGVIGNNFELQAGKVYKFKILGLVQNKVQGNLQCSIEHYDKNKQYSIRAKSNYLVSYFPDDNGFKRVISSNNSVYLGLLDENMKVLVAADSNSFYYNFIQARKYYLIVQNNTDVAIQTSITTSLLNEMALGTRYSALHNQAMCFTNKYSTSVHYKLTLENGVSPIATVKDKFNKTISAVAEATAQGTIYTFLLAANETYYICFSGDLSNNAAATIAISPTNCVWKIRNVAVQESVINLKPNSTYDISIDLYSNGVKIETDTSFICYADGIDCSYSAGKIIIGNVKNNERLVLVSRLAPDFGLTIIVDDMMREVRLMRNDGTSNYQIIKVELDQSISGVSRPGREGYTFKGYYTRVNGQGKQYINEDMQGIIWDIDAENSTLYAFWEANKYEIIIHNEYEYGSYDIVVEATYGKIMPNIDQFAPYKIGYAFDGYDDAKGNKYYEMDFINSPQEAAELCYDYYWREHAKPCSVWNKAGSGELFSSFVLLEMDYSYVRMDETTNKGIGMSQSWHLVHGQDIKITADTIDGYTFQYFTRGSSKITSQTTDFKVRLSRGNGNQNVYSTYDLIAWYKPNECIAQGTLITLADGRQVPVESLKGDEWLLVWNMLTGKLDSARIMFIDKDPAQIYKVINLGFSDGTAVKVISEHGFWDYDLNKFVYLRQDASKYLGHWFNKGETKVQLTSVDVRDEYTIAYSPVTHGHLCYYVNGMLSMPGGIEGLFNIFEVDPDTMTVNLEAMQRDISQYGLYTYAEFAELVPVSEEVFAAFNGQYLKVAVGKGLITVEQLNYLAVRYVQFFA